MTVTNTQMFGLVMGSIPGINIIASVIKFAYYSSQESELRDDASARLKVARTAEKMDEVAQNSLSNIEEDITNLKWYALLQVIPLVGIFFALAEKELLEKVSNLASNLNKVQTNEVGTINVKNKEPKPEVKKIVVDYHQEFELAIDREGTVIICFHETSLLEETERFINGLEELVNERLDSTTLVFVDYSKSSLRDLFELHNAEVLPTTIIRENKTEVNRASDFDLGVLREKILGSDKKRLNLA
ncbi:MAG TPA: hypothetical protein VIH61_07090 [Waddliaceae bacterium]